MYHIKIIIVALLMAVFCSDMYAGDKYLKLIERADQAVEKGEYDNAIGFMQQALQLEPDNSANVMLMSNLGMLSYYTGRDTTALYYLGLAHDMAPESITILTNRAKVYTGLGLYKQALLDLDNIIQLDSTMYRPHLSKGAIFLTLGDMEHAQEALDCMSQLVDAEKSTECTAALAWLAALKGDNEDALHQYSILIAAEPTARLYAYRAMSHTALEHFIEASEDIAEGMKLDDKCADLCVARAYLYKHMHRNDDALKYAQEAIDLGADPDYVKRLLNL